MFAVHMRENTLNLHRSLFTRKIRNAFGFSPSASDFFSLSRFFFLFNDRLRRANKPMACYLTDEFTRTQNCMRYGRRGLKEGRKERRRKRRAA